MEEGLLKYRSAAMYNNMKILKEGEKYDDEDK